jgi:hypothetical protein
MNIRRARRAATVSQRLIAVHEIQRKACSDRACGAQRRARSLSELNLDFSPTSYLSITMNITEEVDMPTKAPEASGRAMRMALVAAVLAGASVPVPAIASAQPAQPSGAAGSSQSAGAVHATRGVVKAISGTTVVVSRPKNRGDISFVLSPTLHQEGTLAVGATVSVRYRDDGKDHVATAISVQKPHQ